MTDDMDDAELMSRLHAGDREAFGTLYARHRHVAAAVARRNLAGADVDDVVAEAFTEVLRQVREGRGPTESFRAYLLTAVRREAVRRRAMAERCSPVSLIERPTAVLEEADHEALLEAFGSLPARWRHVLWRSEVDGLRPRELADELGLSPNAVAALACRARAGLRSAFLDRPEAA